MMNEEFTSGPEESSRGEDFRVEQNAHKLEQTGLSRTEIFFALGLIIADRRHGDKENRAQSSLNTFLSQLNFIGGESRDDQTQRQIIDLTIRVLRENGEPKTSFEPENIKSKADICFYRLERVGQGESPSKNIEAVANFLDKVDSVGNQDSQSDDVTRGQDPTLEDAGIIEKEPSDLDNELANNSIDQDQKDEEGQGE